SHKGRQLNTRLQISASHYLYFLVFRRSIVLSVAVVVIIICISVLVIRIRAAAVIIDFGGLVALGSLLILRHGELERLGGFFQTRRKLPLRTRQGKGVLYAELNV